MALKPRRGSEQRLSLFSITEAAAANGKSVALLRLRCGEGRVKGAVRIGNRWAVPGRRGLSSFRRCGRAVGHALSSITTTSTPARTPVRVELAMVDGDHLGIVSEHSRRSGRPEQRARACQCQGGREDTYRLLGLARLRSRHVVSRIRSVTAGRPSGVKYGHCSDAAVATVPSHAPARCRVGCAYGSVLALDRECRDGCPLAWVCRERRCGSAVSRPSATRRSPGLYTS